jgi:1,4-alpha-glucan branching enzyme
LDVVYNHFGPDNLDLWQFDGWHQHNLGGIYFYNDWRSWTPWGENRPDYGRGEVRQFIRDNAMMWLEDYHMDGLRMDSTVFMRDTRGNAFCADTQIPEAWTLFQWINEEVIRYFPGKIMIAEDLACNSWLTHSTGAGGAGFNAQWDAGFVHPIRQSLTCTEDRDRSMHTVADALRLVYNGNSYSRIIYTESHDEVANGHARVTTEVNSHDPQSYHAEKRSTLGAGIVLTSPGIPMLFEGQEFLETGWFSDDHPLDWKKAESFSGIRALYRDLIRLRLNRRNNTQGLSGSGLNVFHVNDTSKVIAYHRFLNGGVGDDVIMVANFSAQGFESYYIGMPRAGEWIVRFNSDWKGYSEFFGANPYPTTRVNTQKNTRDGLVASVEIVLPPYTLLILSQDC